MRRRLTIVILAVVAATLVLVGAGTLTVAGLRARSGTAAELRVQVRELADATADTLTTGADPTDDAELQQTITRRLAVLRRFEKLLELDDVALVAADRRGLREGLPSGLDAASVDLDALRAGEETSGSQGRTVWAAAATAPGPRGRFLVVIITRTVTRGLADGLRWFVLSAAVTLGLGAVAAATLGRRLSRPIRTASDAAHRIARGDLTVRVPKEDGADELAELADSINTMAAELERSRSVEQEFLLSVSHDLRTPLTSIRGYAEAIVDGAGDPQRSAQVVLAEARRLERLVSDLLDLAKLRSTGFRLESAPLDVVAAVRGAVAGFEPSGTARDISITTGTLESCTVDTDRDRLGQVLSNLLENATKYATAAVEVSVTVQGAWARIMVDDDGPGVSADDAPHVFDRLYVSRHAPLRRESSSGLGLAIVRELVQAMGGHVGVERSAQNGARFVVDLPLTQIER